MDTWKQYVLSIIACTLCCGIVTNLISSSKQKKLIRLICGMALTVTVLYPGSEINLNNLPEKFKDYRYSAQEYVYTGETAAHTEKERYIKNACAAYISNKANVLGAEVAAEIHLNEKLVPVFVEVQGYSGSEAESELARILEMDLGITKENQVWNWNREDSSS